MSKPLQLLLVLSCCLLTPLLAHGDAMVWQAKNKTGEVYVGGTVHMLRKSDYPLPKAYEKAYQKSDLLVFETDMQAMQSTQVQAQIMQALRYETGKTLSGHLSKETALKLKQFLTEQQIPLAFLEGLKPAGLLIMLTALELQKIGVDQESGVEYYFLKKLLEDKKSQQGLAGIDEHIKILSKLGEGYEESFVLEMIESLDQLPNEYEKIVKAWKTGNGKVIETLMTEEMEKQFPELYRHIITDRNEYWASKVDALTKTKEKEFILVGAAHLVGEKSLIKLLKNKGYKVKRVK